MASPMATSSPRLFVPQPSGSAILMLDPSTSLAKCMPLPLGPVIKILQGVGGATLLPSVGCFVSSSVGANK